MAAPHLFRHLNALIASRFGKAPTQPDPSGISWQSPADREQYIEFHISRRTLYALIFSMILHLILFFGFVMPTMDQGEESEKDGWQKELVVSLAQPEEKPQPEMAPPPAAALPPPPPTASKPPPPVVTDKSKPLPKPEQKPAPLPEPQPAPTRPQEPDPSQYSDMSSYIAAMREYRRVTDNNYAAIMETQRAQHESGSRSLADEEKGDEPIKKNLSSGTSGVFRILSMSNYSSTFEFRGWINDFSTANREVFQIEAKAGEDIQRATVRKMIELIRRHYSGNFNWESRQMGHVVVLSARMENSAGLEDFLIKEFFSDDDMRYLDMQRHRPPPWPPSYPVP